MDVLFVEWGQTLTGMGAVLTAMAGCIMAYSAVVKARGEARELADQACLDRLRAARQEAQAMADELHALKIQMASEGRSQKAAGRQESGTNAENDENGDGEDEFREKWSHL